MHAVARPEEARGTAKKGTAKKVSFVQALT
jgi:hypothetical protein